MSYTAKKSIRALAVPLVAVVAVHGETLYQKDGVTLEGTIRMVTREAGVCRVLAAHHPPEVYEQMKANHGQPLHVWRVDYAARNGSGSRLDHLTAHFKIASQWPPCTNWSGPEGSYPKSVVWAGTFEVLQRPYGMGPGELESDTLFVLAFHDQVPKFESWQVDYRFAAGTPLAAVPAAPAPGPAFALPPEIEADRYLLQAEEQIQKQDYEAAKAAMERILQLQQEHELTIPEGFYFRYAQVLQRVGLYNDAVEYVTRYLTAAGREGEHYREALQLLNAAESEMFTADRTCGGKPEGAECWKELKSHPGCYVWDDHYYADQTVIWTGECRDSLASGTGNLKWVRGDDENEHTGLLRGGKHQGDWVERYANGTVNEGPYVEGKRHGRWILRNADGNVAEGSMVDGKGNGKWTVRTADGDVYQGPYVDGEKNGRWVERFASGNVAEGPYVDGKRHGQWIWRYPDGRTESVTYVNGERQ